MAQETKTALELIDRVGWNIAGYRALPAAKAHHQSQSKFRLILGGNRSGKSESNIGFDLCAYALGVHPFRVTPKNATIWACCDTWEMVGSVLWREKVKKYLPAKRILGQPVWHNKAEDIPKTIRLDNGRTIEFKAFMQGRTLFQGRAIHACYVDEQISFDSVAIFNEIQARLMDYNGYYSQSCTPLRPQQWLQDIADNCPPDWSIEYADLNDNRKSRGGYIDDSEIDAMIASWPEEIQATRIAGRFASFVGLVYKTFNPAIHVIPAFKPNPEWRHYRSIDLGYNNPFCCLWGCKDEDDNWYIYDEHYRPQMLLKDHMAEIDRVSGDQVYEATYSDHDAQERAELRELGIRTHAAVKDVNNGIESVQAAFKVRPNGKPGLYITANCKNLIKELRNYSYQSGNERRNPDEAPIKLNDHACDALRYMIHSSKVKVISAGHSIY